MSFTVRRYILVLAPAAAVWLLAVGAALAIGAEPLWELDPEVARGVLMNRLDSAAAATLVGAALAVSGVAFQALLRNPLAEPYVLGVSGGASLGVILGTVLLPASWFTIHVPIGSGGFDLSMAGLCGFAMALATIAGVYLVAQRRGRIDPYRLILTGVIANAFFSALIMLVSAMAGDRLRSEITYWLMGGLGSLRERWGELTVAGVLIAGGIGVFIAQAKGFNLMAFGEDVASSLGLHVGRHRLGAFVVASVLAGASVSLAGPIGFVGLVVPHVLRMLFGSDHRLLVPLSVFGGATFLIAADRLVQVIPFRIAGGLPVGVVTALCGVPFFIVLMRRSRALGGRVE